MSQESTVFQESTIFTYDGQDLVRKHTTLVTEDGKSAVNTKLDRDNPGYKALVQKRSYTGEVTLFGQKCDANYAPLTDEGGQLTGALMVCIKK
jgi:methyl-accepting chemotaxis protein